MSKKVSEKVSEKMSKNVTFDSFFLLRRLVYSTKLDKTIKRSIDFIDVPRFDKTVPVFLFGVLG
jgi:hypothetical protein